MSAQGGPYDLTFALAVDYFFAAVIFMKFCLTISTMTWMVAEGRDAPLKLWAWQRVCLKWLGPRLGKDHREKARSRDLASASAVVGWLS